MQKNGKILNEPMFMSLKVFSILKEDVCVLGLPPGRSLSQGISLP